jgi:hypothetical protein
LVDWTAAVSPKKKSKTETIVHGTTYVSTTQPLMEGAWLIPDHCEPRQFYRAVLKVIASATTPLAWDARSMAVAGLMGERVYTGPPPGPPPPRYEPGYKESP